MGRPNCSRSLAYASAIAATFCAPCADAALSPSRPEFRISSAILKPWPTSPRRSSTGTFTFSKEIVRVSLALIPIFSSILPSETPGACASTRKAVTRSFGLPSITTGTFANTVSSPA